MDSNRAVGRALFILLLAFVCFDIHVSGQSQPRFRTGVDVLSVDVLAVNDRGQPVTDLSLPDFAVAIDGAPRKVLRADWIQLATRAPRQAAAPQIVSTTSNINAAGLLIVLVLDEPNIRFGETAYLRDALNRFIDGLQPADRIAVVGIGGGSPSLPFTADRNRVKQTVAAMRGGRMATELDQTIKELRNVLTGLRDIDAPKTVILVSEGFTASMPGADDPPSLDAAADPTAVIRGVPNAPIDLTSTSWLIELGNLAAQTRTTMYGLYLDRRVTDMTRQESSAAGADGLSRAARRESLATLTVAAGGVLLNVGATPDAAFERIKSELEGYYLLAVESTAADADGRPHRVSVSVARPDVTVRSRQYLRSPVPSTMPRPAAEALGAALATPVLMTAIPLRVATFALRANDGSRVQLLIGAEVDRELTGDQATVAFVISDRTGKAVDTQSSRTRLAPVRAGAAFPLQFTGTATLPPGEYTLKLAISDGDRIGTVEHPVDARLATAGRVTVSQLVVGTAGANGQLRPTVGGVPADARVEGYLETYGSDAGNVKVAFEIAGTERGAALASVDAPVSASAPGRAAFRRALPLSALRAGSYVVRAVVRSGNDVATTTRGIEIAR